MEERRSGEPNTQALVQDAHTALVYLSFPLLDAILKKACGAYVQFDNIGYPLPGVACLERRLVPVIVRLVREGWAHRVLLSQDICHRSHFIVALGLARSPNFPRATLKISR